MTVQQSQADVINRHFRQALDQVDEVVMILDAQPTERPGPRVAYVNQAIASVCGYRVDEVLGQPVSMLYDPATFDAFLERLPDVGRSGMRYFMDVYTACASGKRAQLRWTIRAASSGDGQVLNYYVTMCPSWSNVPRSERKMAENEADGGEDRFSRLESLAYVAGGIAHDFNNVLTTIMANLSLAKMEKDADAMQPMLSNALASCESAKKLIGQLLSFAKGQGTKRSVVNLGSLVKEAVGLSTLGANVRCDVKLSENLPPVEIEPTQMMQVMNNLLINARQAMPNGGVIQVTLNSMVRAEEPGQELPAGRYVELRIRDRGCGIADENLRTIFEPFFTTKRDGSGLGLATTKKIIDQHSGHIQVKSRVNVGTEFRILLPAATHIIEESPVLAADDSELVEGEGLVMIADDQVDVLLVGSMMLERLGYTAIKVASGEAAVREYRQRKVGNDAPVAVIMDHTFPGGMNGDDAAREIMAIDPDARIIASSGYFETSDEERIKGIGYAAILPKPYSPAVLSRTLADLLRTAEPSKVATERAVMV